MNVEKLRYNPTHEWCSFDPASGDSIATIGITDFAVNQLTDLVYMALPKVGQAVKAGSEFGEVESVKAVSPLYSPIDGEVVEVNESLPDHLETLGEDPFEKGWMIKVKISDPGQLSSLLDYATYKQQCEESA